jgi:hypothetical protein
MNLKRRVEQMEKGFHSGVAASLTGRYKPLDPANGDLPRDINEQGQAVISPYWTIWFLEGTKFEQERDLEIYRADSKYKQPPRHDPNWGDLYIEYVHGGCVDQIYLKLHEERIENEGIKP